MKLWIKFASRWKTELYHRATWGHCSQKCLVFYQWRTFPLGVRDMLYAMFSDIESRLKFRQPHLVNNCGIFKAQFKRIITIIHFFFQWPCNNIWSPTVNCLQNNALFFIKEEKIPNLTSIPAHCISCQETVVFIKQIRLRFHSYLSYVSNWDDLTLND